MQVVKKWDRTEKIYAALMYLCEALAVLTAACFMATRDIFIGIGAIVFITLTATWHMMLLVYHRTRLILETLTALKEKRDESPR